MKSRTLLTICMVALLFSACKKEDIADNVYVSKIVLDFSNSGSSVTVSNEYFWENGLMVKTLTTTSMAGMTFEDYQYFEYEGNNLVHDYSFDDFGDTLLNYYYTYEDGRLKRIVSREDTCSITSYNSKGEITGFEWNYGTMVKKITLEWKDGDVVNANSKLITPEGVVTSDTTITFTYDDKPSVYSHHPIAKALSDVDAIAFRGSKHNMQVSGYQYEYKSGRLVRSIGTDGMVATYYYTDGIGPDSK